MPLVTRRFGNTTVEFKSADAAVLQKLVTQRTLLQALDPPDLTLGAVTLHAAAPALTLGTGDHAIRVEASGGASALLGTWDSAAEALAAVAMDDALEPLGVALPRGRYVAMATAYDAAAAAEGRMALGTVPGTLSFGGGISTRATLAVLQHVADDGIGVIPAFEALLDAVRLPRDIRGSTDLRPGTWILAEVDGVLKANVGAEIGYSFNWVRESPTKALVGDLGLKVRLSGAFAYAVQAQSRWVLVVGPGARAQQIRLRILRRRRMTQAGELSLAVGTKATIPLPDSPAAFLDAVFGLRTEQLLKDLRRWLDIATDPTRAADEVLRLSKPQIERLLATIEPVRARLQEALAAWDRLDTIAADAVSEALEVIGTPAVNDLRTLLTLLADARDGAQVGAIVRKELDERGFRGAAQERWLWAVLERGPLDALVDTTAWKQLQQAAQATLAVLDGSAAADLVRTLQQYVEQNVNLRIVRTAADPGALDAWLRGKLEVLLGRAIDASGLKEVKEALEHFDARATELYDRIVDAANDDYAFTLKGAMTSERSREAVVDAEFDTSTAAGRAALAAAMDGDFADLLVNPAADVVVHAGTLIDSIDRRRSVTVAMPFFSATEESITRASARLTVAREGPDVYLLNASNEVRSRTRTSSALAVHAAVPVRGVDVHGRTGGVAYTFRQFTKDARTDVLALQLETYARAYFAGRFGGVPFDESQFAEWINAMERTVNEQAARWDSPALFGTTVVGLDIRMPREALLAWTKAPAAKKAPAYYALSLALQRAMRRWMFFYYFQQLERFTSEPAETLLVFTAMPAFHHAVRTGVAGYELRTGDGNLFWDYRDANLLDFVVTAPQTQTTLARNLAAVRTILAKEGIATQPRFTLPRVTTAMLKTGGFHRTQLEFLLRATSVLIDKAASAGRNMREALDASHPDAVLKNLREFGEDVTETFNRDLGAFTLDQTNFRPLASLIFLEAARVFDPSLEERLVAQLSVTALREDATFTQEDLIKGRMPRAEDVVFDERIVRG